MENEMGAVGVDGGFLSSSLGQEFEIRELTEGCICCSMKTDFATSVLTIENTLQPPYLLIEPTGVGMLGRIIDNLKKIAYERIELLSPITIFDGLNYRYFARVFPEIFSDQLAHAGTIVLSKGENLSLEEKNRLEDWIRSCSPTAEIVTNPYTSQPDDWWKGLWNRALDGTVLKDKNDDVPDPDLFIANLTQTQMDSVSEMVIFLEAVLRGRFGNIVRAKGTARTGDFHLRFDVSGGQYGLTGTENTESKAVFIGRDLNVFALSKALKAKVLPNAS